jgi:hypothetical protein
MSLRTGKCDECGRPLPSPSYMIRTEGKPQHVCFRCKMDSKRRKGEVTNRHSGRR